jgi:hypothetical protein
MAPSGKRARSGLARSVLPQTAQWAAMVPPSQVIWRLNDWSGAIAAAKSVASFSIICAPCFLYYRAQRRGSFAGFPLANFYIFRISRKKNLRIAHSGEFEAKMMNFPHPFG